MARPENGVFQNLDRSGDPETREGKIFRPSIRTHDPHGTVVLGARSQVILREPSADPPVECETRARYEAIRRALYLGVKIASVVVVVVAPIARIHLTQHYIAAAVAVSRFFNFTSTTEPVDTTFGPLCLVLLGLGKIFFLPTTILASVGQTSRLRSRQTL
uniref:Uncharacterized protein n=1 Tax=Anopheles atroparvus TaxID=41427 RepID=A0A182JAU8_ANOAO